MNIIEATKSGKRFRRKISNSEWITQPSMIMLVNGRYMRYFLGPEDILAEDWEIEEPPVSITRAKVEDILETEIGSLISRVNYIEIRDNILQKLGFKSNEITL